MSINVNRSFTHKLIVAAVFSFIFVVTVYLSYTAESGSGLQILSFMVAFATGLVLAWFLCYYSWYAIFASDRYTFQEWVNR